MRDPGPNQITRDVLGVNGLNSFDTADSASRKQMFANHVGQALVINGSTERLCQTGMEREYGKYTFSVKVPGNPAENDGVLVLAILHRYIETLGANSINFNPQTIIIYEDTKTKEVGMINLPQYCSYHQYFGFEYKKQKGLNGVTVGSYLPAGEILLDSPSITDNGGYKYGGEFNVAFMTTPSVSEDGIMIAEDVLERLAFNTFEERTIEFGSKRFPLWMYGDETTGFKGFPDIGDYVRADGILMCLRAYNKELAVVEQGINDLREPDYIHDELVYAPGGGRIVDIRVQHDSQNSQSNMPIGMERQLEKYDLARRQFYGNVLQIENKLRHDRRSRNGELKLTLELHRLCVEARAVIESDQQRIQKLHRQTPLDEWRITFVIECRNIPNIGNKITDCHGGKGVMCNVVKREHMPMDENGVSADIVVDPNSTISRTNIGRLYEHYFNAAGTGLVRELRMALGIEKGDRNLQKRLDELEKTNPTLANHCWERLMGFYKILSPVRMHKWFTSDKYKGTRAYHLADILNNDITKYLPPENEPELPVMLREMEKHYKPLHGPVTYTGYSGKQVKTKLPVRIASMYLILLEKTGDDWTAVASGKLQHFGVLSQVTNTDKYSSPTRQQAIRALGESEVRIYASYVGELATADIMDRNNNPVTHKQVVHNILAAREPTNIEMAVDRNLIPLGAARPIQLVNHIAQCAGWRFVYTEHNPNLPPG